MNRAMFMALAGRPCGVRISEFPAEHRKDAGRMATSYLQAGKVFSRRIAGSSYMRYFQHQRDADAYVFGAEVGVAPRSVKKPPEKVVREPSAADLTREQILALAKRPHGVVSNEIDRRGHTSHWVAQVIWHMRSKGLIFNSEKAGALGRYFDTEERARAYRQPVAVAPTVTLAKPMGRAWWSADAPINHPPHVKVQQCPSPPYAYWTNTYSQT